MFELLSWELQCGGGNKSEPSPRRWDLRVHEINGTVFMRVVSGNVAIFFPE